MSWKKRHTVLLILVIVQAVSFMDRKALSLVLPLIAADFHMGPLAMGLVASAFSASYSIAQIPGGLLADRFGARRVGTVALVWWSAFIAMTGAASNFAHLLVARFGFGLGEGIYPACLFKTIAIWFPRDSRATANSLVTGAANAGKALAPAVVLSVAAYWGWRWSFYILLIPGVIMAALFWIVVKGGPSERFADDDSALPEVEGERLVSAPVSAKGNFTAALLQPGVLRWSFILFAFDIAAWAFPLWLPTYLMSAKGFSVAEMGVTMTFSSMAGAVGAVACGWLSDRVFRNNRRWLVIFAQLLSAVSLVFVCTTSSTLLLGAASVAAGFFLAVFFPAFWALPLVSLSKKTMGTSSGIINLGGQIGGFIAPMLIGFVLQVTSENFVVAFSILIASVLISCAITAAPSGRQRDLTGGINA